MPLRYARHTVLPDFGDRGQQQLGTAKVLLIGVGGLGAPAAMYLTAAGLGNLALSDFDSVDVTNLQRQILFTEQDIGKNKADTAAARLNALNSAVRIVSHPERLQGTALERAVADASLVLDASDNFGTRFAINAACVATGTPLISGAAIRYEGHVAMLDPARGGACYACLYDEDAEGIEDCQSNGVLGPAVGVVGSLMATEAIQWLAGVDTPRHDRLLVYNARSGAWRQTGLKADLQCPVCAGRHPAQHTP